MDKRYQIFISSTYKDLIEERQKVTKAILNLYHFPIGMEMFHADNEKQWTQIKNTIDMSDYFILIVGRYCGTLIDNEEISYTEKEYDYAVSKGIPVFSFIISDNAKKESYGTETSKQQKALKKFIQKVKKLPCEFWSTPEELAHQVSTTLSLKIKENNRDGWIKNESENIFSILNSNFASLDDNQKDELYRKIMYSKLLNNKTEYFDISAATNNLIENKLTLLKNDSMNFYIKDFTKNININLLDECIEIDVVTQYVFCGIPDTESFKFYPWLRPGIEENTYSFESVKYNSIVDLKYIKNGDFKTTPNEAYVAGGIGIEIPYDKDKIVHNITFRAKYCTEYARYFHSYSFKEFCEHFNLSASLHDYRKDTKDKYVLKWEMFTPNQDYGFNSKNKLLQTDTEIKFSPVNWMTPGCGYIITINHVK